MFCPACGEDAGDDASCPSCGADLSRVRRAAEPAPAAASGLRRRLPWIAAALVLMAAVLIVAVRPGADGDEASSGQSGTALSATPTADTSGTYQELVRRANDLYDDGVAEFQDGKTTRAAESFAAAAEIYAAAWGKKPGDPNVGTDWATSLFYSGDIDGAVARVDMVLAANPGFQAGHYNRGNYLEHRARLLDEEGDEQAAAEALQAAAASYRKAVKIDPDSDTGKAAAQRLASMESGE